MEGGRQAFGPVRCLWQIPAIVTRTSAHKSESHGRLKNLVQQNITFKLYSIATGICNFRCGSHIHNLRRSVVFSGRIGKHDELSIAKGGADCLSTWYPYRWWSLCGCNLAALQLPEPRAKHVSQALEMSSKLKLRCYVLVLAVTAFNATAYR
jgi:hypothetical protein